MKNIFKNTFINFKKYFKTIKSNKLNTNKISFDFIFDSVDIKQYDLKYFKINHLTKLQYVSIFDFKPRETIKIPDSVETLILKNIFVTLDKNRFIKNLFTSFSVLPSYFSLSKQVINRLILINF